MHLSEVRNAELCTSACSHLSILACLFTPLSIHAFRIPSQAAIDELQAELSEVRNNAAEELREQTLLLQRRADQVAE